jgi:hypothetical protein
MHIELVSQTMLELPNCMPIMFSGGMLYDGRTSKASSILIVWALNYIRLTQDIRKPLQYIDSKRNGVILLNLMITIALFIPQKS